MKIVRQMYKTDCGVACVAMLADVSYDLALQTVSVSHRQITNKRYRADKGGTSTRAMVMSLFNLGCDIPEGPEVKAKRFQEIPPCSLVNAGRPRSGKGTHWVVWTGSRVYCPSDGVRGVTKYNWRPYSYIHAPKNGSGS